MFDRYLMKWKLTPDGEPIFTRSSRLLPVRSNGNAAMLKVPMVAEEKVGSALMVWWAGDGAAMVLAQDDDAILLERAEGPRSLVALATGGRDEEATRIISGAVERLHAPRSRPPPVLVPLRHWFQALEPAALAHGGILLSASTSANQLLDGDQDVTVLHGDIHHENVLDFGRKGWLAIDPKGLIGDRAFDYANLFCNPQEHDSPRMSEEPDAFHQRLKIVSEAAGLDRSRLLRWILAWCGLSAAWCIADGADSSTQLKIAEMAVAELAR